MGAGKRLQAIQGLVLKSTILNFSGSLMNGYATIPTSERAVFYSGLRAILYTQLPLTLLSIVPQAILRAGQGRAA